MAPDPVVDVLLPEPYLPCEDPDVPVVPDVPEVPVVPVDDEGEVVLVELPVS
jgi:hypothetical protein